MRSLFAFALAAVSIGCSYGVGVHAGPALVGNDPQWSGGGDFEATVDLGWTERSSASTLWVQGRAHGAALERYGVLSIGGALGYSYRTDFGALFLHGGIDALDLHITPTGPWGGAFGPFARLGVGFALARTGLETSLEESFSGSTLARSSSIETTLLTVSVGAEYDVLFETTHVAIFTARVGIVWWSENVGVRAL